MRCKDAVSLAPAKNGFRKPCVVKNSAQQPSDASREPSWNRVREFRAGIQVAKCVPPVTTSNSLVLGLDAEGVISLFHLYSCSVLTALHASAIFSFVEGIAGRCAVDRQKH